jgi:alpha-tubulin suppressor-like RCC1 family protein
MRYVRKKQKRVFTPMVLPKIYPQTVIALSEFRGAFLGKKFVPRKDGLKYEIEPIEEMNVRKVVAGDRQSYIIMESGNVYAFGEDSHNELGLDLSQDTSTHPSQMREVYTPSKISNVKGVIDLSAHEN